MSGNENGPEAKAGVEKGNDLRETREAQQREVDPEGDVAAEQAEEQKEMALAEAHESEQRSHQELTDV